MKRREALKNIGLAAGVAVSTPSLLSLLQSCTADVTTWTPSFFTEEQGLLLRGIVDTILPKSDTPSASEVNVPEFIDRYVNEVSSKEYQVEIKRSFESLLALVKENYSENISKLSDDDYKDLLDNHMKLSGEEGDDDPNSQILNRIKGISISAYRSSEIVAETILAYDPVPAAYYCGDLQELTGGRSWSL
jgi:hypothetical protein